MNWNFMADGPVIVADLDFDELIDMITNIKAKRNYPYQPIKSFLHEVAHYYAILGSNYGFNLQFLANYRYQYFEKILNYLDENKMKLKQPWINDFKEHYYNENDANELTESIQILLGMDFHFLYKTEGSFLNQVSRDSRKYRNEIFKHLSENELDYLKKIMKEVYYYVQGDNSKRGTSSDIIESYADYWAYFAIAVIQFENHNFEVNEGTDSVAKYLYYYFIDLNTKLNNHTLSILLSLFEEKYKIIYFWGLSLIIFDLSMAVSRFGDTTHSKYDDYNLSISERFSTLIDYFNKNHEYVNSIMYKDAFEDGEDFVKKICSELNWYDYYESTENLVTALQEKVDASSPPVPYYKLALDVAHVKNNLTVKHFELSPIDNIFLYSISKKMLIPFLTKDGFVSIISPTKIDLDLLRQIQRTQVARRVVWDVVYENDFSRFYSLCKSSYPKSSSRAFKETLESMSFYKYIDF